MLKRLARLGDPSAEQGAAEIQRFERDVIDRLREQIASDDRDDDAGYLSTDVS